MIGRQRTWSRGATLPRRTHRVRWDQRLGRIRIPFNVHPLRWARGSPVPFATVLLSLAVLIYLFQVNKASWLEFNLNQTTIQQTKLNAITAHLLVQKDALLAESRIDAVASSKLHMRHPSLNSALWLKVSVPATVPRIPPSRRVSTGPLDWMRHAVQTIRESL